MANAAVAADFLLRPLLSVISGSVSTFFTLVLALFRDVPMFRFRSPCRPPLVVTHVLVNRVLQR